MNVLIYIFCIIHIAPDIADISRIFFEVIRSELNANQMPEFVIHEKPCLAHAASVVDTKTSSNLDQDSNQSKSMLHYLNWLLFRLYL